MKKMLLGFAALPFLAGVALAADKLNDAQMAGISAGGTINCPTCGTCTGSGSCSTSGFVIPATLGTPFNLNALFAAYEAYLAGQSGFKLTP